jgi:hypothetical protein
MRNQTELGGGKKTVHKYHCKSLSAGDHSLKRGLLYREVQHDGNVDAEILQAFFFRRGYRAF